MNKLILTLILILSSCGPTITKSPKLKENTSPFIALIPSKTIDGISRERLEYISELTRLNLESRGYFLITPDTINRNCVDLECSNIDEVSSKFNIGKIAHINLESSTNIDILAGYYSSLTGQLIIEDPKGISLYSALHTERDSGGLILESGQVIQAIINQIRNGDESSVDRTSYRFVRALLKEMPKVDKSLPSETTPLNLENVEVSKYSKNTKKVCAKGTPNQTAWLTTSSKLYTELKEIKKGLYCGVFRLEGPWALSNKLTVELKSAYGQLVRLEVK